MTGSSSSAPTRTRGKTAFSLLFLTAFADAYAYWKPVETGDSDTDKVRQLVPSALVFPPLTRSPSPSRRPSRRDGKGARCRGWRKSSPRPPPPTARS